MSKASDKRSALGIHLRICAFRFCDFRVAQEAVIAAEQVVKSPQIDCLGYRSFPFGMLACALIIGSQFLPKLEPAAGIQTLAAKVTPKPTPIPAKSVSAKTNGSPLDDPAKQIGWIDINKKRRS